MRPHTAITCRNGLAVSAGLLALLILSGCGQKTAPSAATGTPAAPAATPTSDASKVTMDVPLAVGSGPFDLASPAVGLDKLTGYHAALVVSFDGTRDGKPEKWSRNYSMLVGGQGKARQLTIAMTAQPPDKVNDPPNPLPQTELNGLLYEGGDKLACGTKVIGTDATSLSESEPAIFLPSVFGADEAGDATVNKVASKHYKFDEKALALADGAPYTGELWVAADGGYLVKYTLSSKAGPEVYGEGVEGTMTWQYDLTDANKPVDIAVPKGCPPGQLDAPEMPGAANVVKSVATTSFEIPGKSIDDVLAFYQDKLTAAGWTAPAKPITQAGKMGSVFFTKGDLKISVVAFDVDGVTNVTLSLASAIPQKVK